MSREIKFKAWNGEYFLPLEDDGDYYFRDDGNGLELWNKRGRCKNVTLLQFTGLLDCKGNEIYEGDIVKFHYFYGSGGLEGFVEAEHELTGIVKWGNFGWGLEAIKGQHWQGYTGYVAGEGSSNFLDLMAMNESSVHEESFEILGNLYQHPELLTNK